MAMVLATLYAHLSKINVKANQSVKAGEVITQSGNWEEAPVVCITGFIKQISKPKLFLNL